MPATPNGDTIRIFVSYRRETDSMWFPEHHSTGPSTHTDLIARVKRALERHNVEIRYDVDRIAGGDEWRKVLDRELEEADVAVLLLSDGFLTSSFIREVELPKIRERHEAGELEVLPVLTEYTSLDGDSPEIDFITRLQIVPGGVKPLIESIESLSKWSKACHEISEALKERVRAARKRLGDDTKAADRVSYSEMREQPKTSVQQEKGGGGSGVRRQTSGRRSRGEDFSGTVTFRNGRTFEFTYFFSKLAGDTLPYTPDFAETKTKSSLHLPKLKVSGIARIDFIEFNGAELKAFREEKHRPSFRKTRVTFRDGEVEEVVYLDLALIQFRNDREDFSMPDLDAIASIAFDSGTEEIHERGEPVAGIAETTESRSSQAAIEVAGAESETVVANEGSEPEILLTDGTLDSLVAIRRNKGYGWRYFEDIGGLMNSKITEQREIDLAQVSNIAFLDPEADEQEALDKHNRTIRKATVEYEDGHRDVGVFVVIGAGSWYSKRYFVRWSSPRISSLSLNRELFENDGDVLFSFQPDDYQGSVTLKSGKTLAFDWFESKLARDGFPFARQIQDLAAAAKRLEHVNIRFASIRKLDFLAFDSGERKKARLARLPTNVLKVRVVFHDGETLDTVFVDLSHLNFEKDGKRLPISDLRRVASISFKAIEWA